MSTLGQRVLVLGSANMDVVVTAERIPAPGETVTGHDLRHVPGGKGANQARAAALAGLDVAFAGAVGEDAHGAALRAGMVEVGIDVDLLRTVGAPTGTAHITVAGDGENSIVVVPGANAHVTVDDQVRTAIAAADVLICQLEVPLPVVAEALGHARAHGTRSVLTPAPVQPLSDDLLADVDVLVANQHEAELLTGIDDPTAAAAALRARGIATVVVTLGGDGAVAVDADGTFRQPARRVPVSDTTGAGDAFVGTLVAGLVRGGLAAALALATSAAALAVQRPGAAAMPTLAEVLKFHGAGADEVS